EITTILLGAGGLAVGALLFYVLFYRKEQQLAEKLTRDAEQKLKDAEAQAEAKLRAADIDAKDIVFKAKSAAEKEADQRRAELLGQEKRLGQKEEQIDKRLDQV